MSKSRSGSSKAPPSTKADKRIAEKSTDATLASWSTRRVALFGAAVTLLAALIGSATSIYNNSHQVSTGQAAGQTSATLSAPSSPPPASPALTAAPLPFEFAVGVANVTKGDQRYSPSVYADNNDVVKFEIAGRNMSTERKMSGLHLELMLSKVDDDTGSLSVVFTGPIEKRVSSATVKANMRSLESLGYAPDTPATLRATGKDGAMQDTVLSVARPGQASEFDIPVLDTPLGRDSFTLTVSAIVVTG